MKRTVTLSFATVLTGGAVLGFAGEEIINPITDRIIDGAGAPPATGTHPSLVPAAEVPAADAPLDDHIEALMNAWGPCGSEDCLYDLTDDGIVGADDLVALLGGARPAPSAVGQGALALCESGQMTQIPARGRPVPSLQAFDSMMVNFLAQGNTGIDAAVLGIMKDGEIVYLRAFGWLDPHVSPPVPMQENALVRLASVTKPVTAAAVRHLIETHPNVNLHSYAFDLGQNGLLDVDPFDYSCCNAHFGVGCRTPACEQLICSDDPYCCNTAWDSICASAANANCGVCDGFSDCCHTGGPGCDDPACQALICDDDPYCCDVAWDGICAAAAEEACYVCHDELWHTSINVEHLLRHQGGWDRDVSGESNIAGDLTYREIISAGEMGVASPPGRENTMDWIIGRPQLQFYPGTDFAYSNIGYLALGMIVEQYSGLDLMTYIHQNVLTPDMGVPWHEIQLGTTFREWNLGREPWYRHPCLNNNVFDNHGPSSVCRPYGGYHHEARVGQGGMIATAATMLTLAEHYHIGRGDFTGSFDGSTIGLPREEFPLGNDRWHGGVIAGANSSLYQRADGINFFVFVNHRNLEQNQPPCNSASPGHADALRDAINNLIDTEVINWPSTTSDGFWIEPYTSTGGGPYAVGAYDAPINGLADAVLFLSDGSKLRLVPGSGTNNFNWTGTIDKQVTIDAPLGTVVIGQ